MQKSLYDWLSTEFKNGEMPKVGGIFHIASLFICLITASVFIILFWKLKNKHSVTLGILLTIWSIMVISEILKQWYVLKQYKLGIINQNVYIGYFPFFLCDMPLYFIPLYLACYKFKKLRLYILDFLGIFSLYGGAIVLSYPSEIFKANIFLTVHSIFFHSIMLVLGSYLVITNIVKLSWKSVFYAFAVFVVLWASVGIINEILWRTLKSGRFNEIPNLLKISHRLQNPFGDAIKNITNGKVKFSDLTIYLAYPLWTFIVSNIIYGFFGFVGWSARKIEASAKLHYETKLQNKAMLRRKNVAKESINAQ